MNVTRQNMQNLRMLFCRISLARSLVYLFCTSLFLYQLIKLLPSYFAPTLTHTEVAQMQLKDIDDFPLNIKVCVRPGLNKTALKQLGYVDKVMFIMGRSQLNGSLIGWGGHSQFGSLKSAEEVAKMTKIDRKRNLLIKFAINTNSKNTQKDFAPENDLVENVSLQEVNIVHDCHILKLSKLEAGLKGVRMIAMIFNQTLVRENLLVELRLEGKSLSAHRDIQDHHFYSSGDALKLNGYSNYRVKIKRNIYVRGENVFVEGHPGKSCHEYPNSDFESYMACDDQYMRKKIKKFSPPGFFSSSLQKRVQSGFQVLM